MDRKSYWQYIKESLDIDSFILPLRHPKTILYNPQAGIGFFSTGELSGEELKLFEKMVAAMGLTTETVALYLGWPISDTSLPCRVRVVLENEVDSPVMGTWQNLLELQIFTTYSLNQLLSQPELKKKAWEHLKNVISIYSCRQEHPQT